MIFILVGKYQSAISIHPSKNADKFQDVKQGLLFSAPPNPEITLVIPQRKKKPSNSACLGARFAQLICEKVVERRENVNDNVTPSIFPIIFKISVHFMQVSH